MDKKWEKDPMDQKWIEEAKKTAELLEPPESLSPKAVTDRLKQENRRPKRPFRIYRAAAVLVIFLILGGGSLWMFRMLGSDRKAEIRAQDKAESEMSEAASKLSGSYRAAKSYEEIYEYLNVGNSYWMSEDIWDIKSEVTFEETAAASGDAASAEAAVGKVTENTDYSKTNVQVNDIDESDIVKTDGKYLYVVYSEDMTGQVHIIEIDDGNMREIAQTGPITEGIYRDYDSALEIYLDGNTMTVIMDCIEDSSGDSYTATAVYDITDREEPKLTGLLSQDGTYLSSRKNGNYVYVFTLKYTYAVDKNEVRDFIPYVDGAPVSCKNIYYSEDTDADCVLVAASVDTVSPDRFVDTEAVYYGGSIMYVSNDAIYAAGQCRIYDGNKSQSDLFKISYADGRMEPVGSRRILGRINDQFSMDQYNGYLRLAATVDDYKTDSQANSLYVLDKDLNVVGSIHNLAPDERIYSARFMGDTGYFVTFRETDPLFSVDLSDPEDPRIMGELKITGFSSYLQFYGDGKLLGIGKEVNPRTGESEGIKLSMFDISDPYDVKEQDKTVLKDSYASPALNDHKAVLIDTERNLFGFCTMNCETDSEGYEHYKLYYMLYTYEEGEGFKELLVIPVGEDGQPYDFGWYDGDVRGVYVGNTLYLTNIGPYIRAYSLESGEKLGEIRLKSGK